MNVCISPSGKLRLVEDVESSADINADESAAVAQAFASSEAEGLLLLAGEALEWKLGPAIAFWREFARRFLERLCQLPEVTPAACRAIAPLAPPDAESLLSAAPPMPGGEYLTAAVLERLWHDLCEGVAERREQFTGEAESFLQSLNPVWHALGRVTFHLAENKEDERRPFAFLATYASRVSESARVQHLPLSDAVKRYAGQRDQPRLAAILEPVRRASEKSALVKSMLADRSLFAPLAFTAAQAHRLLLDAPHLTEAGVVLRLPNWWRPKRPTRAEVEVRVGQKSGGTTDSLFDFSVALSLDGEPLTEAERQRILEASEGLVLLRGKWVEANGERLREVLDHWELVRQEHAQGVSFAEGMRLLAGVTMEEAPGEQQAAHDWSRVTAGDRLRSTLEQIRDPQEIEGYQPGRNLRATLRPYQIDGSRWLCFMTRLGLGACLADDMGLGKTIQVIDLILQRRAKGEEKGPSLLVVPASLVGNWRREFEKFAPQLRVLYAHRSECDAETLQRLAENPQRELRNVDAVITTYTLVRTQSWPASMHWQRVVLDEAQNIKNSGSSQTKAVKKLPTNERIVLTGTPVENHLGDLWSLFDFCNPGLLGTAAQFKKYAKGLEKQQTTQAYAGLRKLVRPYILRRLKTDPGVAPDLPEKTEMRAECGLSKRQAVLYERSISELERRLATADGMARRGLVLSVLMQLKQICNHPAQFLGDGNFAPADSGKFLRLAELCEPIAAKQERVLVFTQFQSLTEPVADYLAGVFGRPGLVLHGGTPVKQRSKLVQQFQADDGPSFFVISLKAGGSGLNLTAASHVVHFDRWWNPAVENQATDRAFRIGQKRNVLVHKFVCRGTLEERIDQMLEQKKGLADEVLEEGGAKLLTEMSNDELLRFVALDATRSAE